MKTLAILILVNVMATSAMAQSKPTVMVRGSLNLHSPNMMGKPIIKGIVLTASPEIDMDNAKDMAKWGFRAAVSANSTLQVTECADAIIKLSASEGNFLPNIAVGMGYTNPIILSFKCNSL